MMNRISHFALSHSKKAWFLNHVKDEHVKKAQAQGFRSRAAFKLLEIEEKFSILKEATTALDLGSAPGSWSQAIKSICPNTKIAAVDLLPMKELDGVTFFNADARNTSLHRLLRQQFGEFEILVSDMAPNFSGTLF
jgi:23S rRNA (uridine2552-2'-O)-methyltransferase